jgi:hypothetical protein
MRYLRSSAWVDGCPALDALAQCDLPIKNFRRSIERNVRYAIPATIQPSGVQNPWHTAAQLKCSRRLLHEHLA